LTTIAIVNACTVLTDVQIAAAVPALQAQVTEDWLPHWPGRGATVVFVAKGGAIPAGAWPLRIMDTTDVPGAGGYHDDDGGTPEGKVFAADALQYGEAWTVDTSHELLEMLGDPTTNIILPLPGHPGLHCAQEVCDAVEADRYGYMKGGFLLSDFCLPAYFSPHAPGPFDFKRHLPGGGRAPALLHGGYLGIELANGEWTQIVKRREDGSLSRRAAHSRRAAEICAPREGGRYPLNERALSAG
jgi:hypothetical protein